MIKKFLRILLITIMALTSIITVAIADIVDYSAEPPFLSAKVDPNVLFNLSIETPMQGAAYNDQNDGGNCGGRISFGGGTVGMCYFKAQEYLGIFDPNKCYTYSVDKFVPSGFTNADHECTVANTWSGNFLNWATMTAIDEFRWALTGGNRVVDTVAETVIQRANMTLGMGHSWYPIKMIRLPQNVQPNTVTPYSASTIYIYNHGYQFDIGTTRGGHELAQNLNVKVKVCDQTQGLEKNCVDCGGAGGGRYKPFGLIQKNAEDMRFAVMSYSFDNDKRRDGGVLRSNMKYVGPKLPSGAVNTAREFDADGIIRDNPEGAATGNSGVINYINKFGQNGYKSYDPVGELYYECLNFYKNRGPTSEYYTGLTVAEKDGFPVLTTWEDPIQYPCQKNYIIAINDANPWLDKQLPGTYFTASSFNGHSLAQGTDYGVPSNPDPDINVTTFTNTVGRLEGLNGTTQRIGCTAVSCDMNVNNLKNIPGLGEVMGTAPWAGKENSYYVAGLSYYANTYDLRSDLDGRQTVNTFMIDSQEYNANPLVGQMNMLWLTGKYGGFEEKDFLDTNSDGNVYEPNLQEEWDKDGDGLPDNYVLASDPLKLIQGLTNAFIGVLGSSGSGTAASVISNSRSGEGAIYQAMFHTESDPDFFSGEKVSWYGDVHTLFVDDYGNIREDSNTNGILDFDTDLIVLFNETNANARLYYPITHAPASLPFDPLNPNPNFHSEVNFSELDYIWSGFNWLSGSTMDVTNQRTPYASIAHKRYIFTDHINTNLAVATNNVDDSLIMDFTPNFVNDSTNDNYYFLNPANSGVSYTETQMIEEAQNIINFVRGKEGLTQTGTGTAYRNRTIDTDNSGNKVYRLGDIIHSTPTVVTRPAEAYDLLYRDSSYGSFRKKYYNRRTVVYAGANDGMLHAFNGGFYNPWTYTFSKQHDGETEFDLGTELWAYVPNALLPHLKWLTQELFDDNHVYYVDLKPRIFDARIFFQADGITPLDADHPGGWGTVLLGGMKFGGGPIGVDTTTDASGNPAPDGTDDLNFQSTYFALDITNPEAPPRLLWSFTDPNLGFTTNYPTPMRVGSKWFIVIGSGPVDYEATRKDDGINFTNYGGSNRTASLYILNADDGSVAREFTMDDHSFMADPIAVDFDLKTTLDVNNNTLWTGEAIYVASDGAEDSQNSKIFRIQTNGSAPTDWENPANWIKATLFDPNTLTNDEQHITTALSVAKDDDDRIWLYFGTGRFWSSKDREAPYLSYKNSFYGIKEPVDANGVLTYGTVGAKASTLRNVTGIEIEDYDTISLNTINPLHGAAVVDQPFPLDDGIVDFSDLEAEVEAKDGWYLNFDDTGERNLGQAATFGSAVMFTTFIPNNDLCEYEGNSYLYGLYYKTGTGYYKGMLKTDDNNGTGIDPVTHKIVTKLNIGKGYSETSNIHIGRNTGSKAFVQTSTGAIIGIELINPGHTKSGITSWQEME